MRRLLVLVVLMTGLVTACTAPPPVTTPAPRTIVPVPTSLQVIPGQPPIAHHGTVEHAEIGVAYEYHLLVHCGVHLADFDGRLWLADPRTGPEPPNDGSQYSTGSMTLLAPDRARFEWPGGSADFSPATGKQALCS